MSQQREDASVESLTAKVKELGPWFHQIDVGRGVRTRDVAPAPGPQPTDHPRDRWEKIEPHLPHDLSGQTLLDVGCNEGFFSVELARRGAQRIVSVDNAPAAIARLQWLAQELELPAIEARCASIYDLPKEQVRYDAVLMLALLYHLKEPLHGLESVAALTDVLYIETIVLPDAENAYLSLKPPLAGVHAVPKWIPTRRCLEEMLHWAGFRHLQELSDPGDTRPILLARK